LLKVFTTTVDVSKLRQSFNTDDVELIRTSLGETYDWFIRNNCEIKLNGKPSSRSPLIIGRNSGIESLVEADLIVSSSENLPTDPAFRKRFAAAVKLFARAFCMPERQLVSDPTASYYAISC
jgi:hypothetical protein